jgi:hypothetical protein
VTQARKGQLHSAQQHLNMKYIILDRDEILAEAASLPSRNIIAGSNDTGLIGYDNIPAKYNSNTAYTIEQVETMMRDSSSVYYVQGF